jgi:hypothetical protein
LQRELEDLLSAGASYSIDEEARALGLLRLDPVEWPWEGGFVSLVAEYPDFFPYFRPEVMTRDLQLPKHQDPVRGALCLINRDTRNWRTNSTLATYLLERLPLLVTAATTRDSALAASLEEHQGEPISDFLPYLPAGVIMVDGHWIIPPDEVGGDMTIGVDPALPVGDGVLRGAVLEVKDASGSPLCTAMPRLGQLFPYHIACRWARLPSLPAASDARAVIKAALTATPAVRFGPHRSLANSQVAILGLLFPEEVVYRETKESWVFALEVRR